MPVLPEKGPYIYGELRIETMKSRNVIRSFPSLDVRKVCNRRAANDPILGKERVRFYASGRAALYHIVKSMNIPAGGVILLPSYHCGVEVEAVLRAGAGVEFYSIGQAPSLRYDFNELTGKIGSKTKGIVVVHYFGFPQEMAELRHACREMNIALIEDCAHAMYSRHPEGEWLGTHGDYGVFSMRKTVFLPNGGAALVNSSQVADPENGEKHFDVTLLKSTVKSMLEYKANCGGIFSELSGKILSLAGRCSSDSVLSGNGNGTGNQRWYYDVPRFDYRKGISALSLLCAGNGDVDEIIERRRRNYLALQKRLDKSLADDFVFPELPEGTCPLCFPLHVRNRDKVAIRMAERGVEPFIFGRTFHPLLKDHEFPETKFLSDSIISLPVHQQLTEENLREISDVFFASLYN